MSEAHGAFTVSTVGTGGYRFEFPDGTFDGCHTPIVTATPHNVASFAAAGFSGCTNQGGGFALVLFYDRNGAPRDTSFNFIAQ